MNKTELLELIANHEDVHVEFMRDDCRPEDLAKEMSALLNLEGSVILPGIEGDGPLSGLTRSRQGDEEWAMNAARESVPPACIPIWTCIDMGSGKQVGVIELAADRLGKPHKARRGRAWVTFSRVGSTSRESTCEEEFRLHQAARMIRYEIKAVPDTGLGSLNMELMENYYRDVLQRSVPT